MFFYSDRAFILHNKFVLFLVSADLFSLPFPIIVIQAEGQNIEVVAEGLLLKKLKMWCS